MLRPEYQKGKQYTGDSSQGIRYPLVPLWGSKNEVVAPKCRFQNTQFWSCSGLCYKVCHLGAEHQAPK